MDVTFGLRPFDNINIMFTFISFSVSHNIDNLKPPIIVIIWYDVEDLNFIISSILKETTYKL